MTNYVEDYLAYGLRTRNRNPRAGSPITITETIDR